MRVCFPRLSIFFCMVSSAKLSCHPFERNLNIVTLFCSHIRHCHVDRNMNERISMRHITAMLKFEMALAEWHFHCIDIPTLQGEHEIVLLLPGIEDNVEINVILLYTLFEIILDLHSCSNYHLCRHIHMSRIIHKIVWEISRLTKNYFRGSCAHFLCTKFSSCVHFLCTNFLLVMKNYEFVELALLMVIFFTPIGTLKSVHLCMSSIYVPFATLLRNYNALLLKGNYLFGLLSSKF